MNRRIEIIETCDDCNGEREVDVLTCSGYAELMSCPSCEGTGKIREQISIPELARLITEAQAMEGAGS